MRTPNAVNVPHGRAPPIIPRVLRIADACLEAPAARPTRIIGDDMAETAVRCRFCSTNRTRSVAAVVLISSVVALISE